MKKIIFSVLAIAAVAACSKSEVQYESPAEIGFAPVKGNITKATGLSGDLDDTQNLGIWAFWDKDGVIEPSTSQNSNGETVTIPINYNNYTESYLSNALFKCKGDDSWGAPTGYSYPWPVNGSLVFAGYTTPSDNVLTNDSVVKYTLADDTMVFTNYENTNEFDLCWFGRTASSYNNRVSGDPIQVELSHALTWVTIAVYGDATVAGKWIITGMDLNKVAVSGTATCNGSTKKATWDSVTLNNVDNKKSIGNSLPHTITSGTTTETSGGATVTTGVTIADNVLIPSKDVELTINYKFNVNGVDKTDSKTVTLNKNTLWVSGVHYTYTLIFKANEILVAPSYGKWEDGTTPGITVE